MSEETSEITLTVNGDLIRKTVNVRQHLVDFLRLELGLTGSHLGCEHGICGACSVWVDGLVVRGCLMLAVQADGMDVTYDMYPYTAAGTDLKQLVPEWLQEGGIESMLNRQRS